MKFKKPFATKVISVLLSAAFLCNAQLYAYPVSKGSLRVPVTDKERMATGHLAATGSDGHENSNPQLTVLMAYIAGDELPGLEKERFEGLEDLAGMVRKFLKEKVAPYVQEWEDLESHKEGDRVVSETLEDVLRQLAGLGIFGISAPEEYNGLGLGHYYTYRIIEILSNAWPSLAVTIGVNASVMDAINKFGTEKQKQDILKGLAEKGLGAIAITESDAGSDVMNMGLSAHKHGNSYILNGRKIFITSAGIASVYIVFAVTDKGGEGGRKKISAFLVDKGTLGFSIGTIEKKMGQKASPTGELIFDKCEIPEDAMLGKPGEGMNILYYMLTGGRIGIASLALGIAKLAYDAASSYAEQRITFGKAIDKHEEIKDTLDRMRLYIDASELLIRYASFLKDQGAETPEEINAMVTAASMAKLFASEKGEKVVRDALQIHGGAGYTREYPLARYLQDIIVTTIYEGTSQIQKKIIKGHIALFLSPEAGIEKAIDGYLKTYPYISGYEQEIIMIYEAINKAREKLRRAIDEKKVTYSSAELLVDLVITRLMLFKAIFLANQGTVAREIIRESLDKALFASVSLRNNLDEYNNLDMLETARRSL